MLQMLSIHHLLLLILDAQVFILVFRLYIKFHFIIIYYLYLSLCCCYIFANFFRFFNCAHVLTKLYGLSGLVVNVSAIVQWHFVCLLYCWKVL